MRETKTDAIARIKGAAVCPNSAETVATETKDTAILSPDELRTRQTVRDDIESSGKRACFDGPRGQS